VAISIGIGVGLVFTYGIWVANNSLKKAGVTASTPLSPSVPVSPSAGPTPIANPSAFSLFSPEDNLLTNVKTLTLTGNRDSGALIIVYSENSQYVIPASNSGQFSFTVPLDTGYNRLKIISLSPGTNRQTIINRLATYSTTAGLFTNPAISLPSPTASPSQGTLRDSVKEKVAEQIAQIKSNTSKKAFLGNMTTKSEASLNMVSYGTTTTHQITVTAETVIKLKNNSEGTIKDLKAGDYLLAMGDAGTDGNLVALRILVIDKPAFDNRQLVSGTVTAFTSKTLSLDKTVLNISKDTVFYPNKYKFKDIDPGFNLIAVTNQNTTPLIYVVSEK